MSRSYLFPTDGEPLRLSSRVVSGLVSGKDSFPQYAGSKQRVLTAFLELDSGKPVSITGTQGSVWEFDGAGSIWKGLHKAIVLATNSLPAPNRVKNETVVQLRPHSDRNKLQKEYRWEPTAAEINRIIADIWPKKKGDRLKLAQGVSKRRPPLTYDARDAIDEISKMFWKVTSTIERLKEPSQKGFGFEARERAQSDSDFPELYRALADISDWHLELERRRKSGKGIWYAVVEIMYWHDGIGEAVRRFHERCEGRDKAVAATRRMLAQHVDKFDAHTTIDAELLTDLEWDRRAYDDL